jgi:hypothetical protein
MKTCYPVSRKQDLIYTYGSSRDGVEICPGVNPVLRKETLCSSEMQHDKESDDSSASVFCRQMLLASQQKRRVPLWLEQKHQEGLAKRDRLLFFV